MNQSKVLFLSLSGIGNLIMQLPTIQEFKRRFPNSHITVWTAPRGTSQLARSQEFIDDVFTAPISRSLLLQFGVIRNLNKRNFDTAIMLSPGQLWKGTLHLTLAGIPERIGHSYPHLGNSHSSFLLSKTLPEDESLHDIEQNLNLISLLTSSPPPLVKNYSISIPAKNAAGADNLLSNLNIPAGMPIIGLHAGSAPGFTWKRWPISRFSSVAQSLIKNHSAFILIFGGPEEITMQKEILRSIGRKYGAIIKSDLLTTAAAISRCQLFISNDSGLMHLAAAAGTPTIGLFGPTDETKTGPRGPHSYTLRAPGTKPVYHTETNSIRDQSTHPTLLSLQEVQLIDFIKRLNLIRI